MAAIGGPGNLAAGPKKSRTNGVVGGEHLTRNCQETSVHYLLNAMKCAIIGSFQVRWQTGFSSGMKKEQ
ncbi:MAG: hypothetical protein CMJ75_12375 [Planctomycetaceae bacterium]|nr:hypothetical protein [Planctomycetaceae bacterium]